MRVIHLLNWKLKSIEKILDYVKEQGFDTIQINPMQPFKESDDFHWWLTYQPLGFRIGNIFGTKEDLKSLCKKANEKGINIIVDVIANHMANKDGNNPLVPHESVDKELTENKDFWKPKVMITDGDNKYDACHGLIGLPGLNQNNSDLQLITLRYLKELATCGVKGFRFDAAKHIGLPSDGVTFFPIINKFLKLNNLYSYGEFLGGYYEWRNELLEYMDILTDPNCPVYNSNSHVTFIESHDNYLNKEDNSTMFLTKEQLEKLYYVLCENFNKTINYPRPINALYNPYKPAKKMKEILNSDELDCFDTSFLTSPTIKEANNINNQKELKLLKKSI